MKQSTFPNIVLSVIFTAVLMLLIGMFSAIKAQDNNYSVPLENVLDARESTIHLEIGFEKKDFDKALKILIDKGMKARKFSRVDVSVPQGSLYWTVRPVMEDKLTYYLYYREEKEPLFSSTRIADIRDKAYDLTIKYLNNI